MVNLLCAKLQKINRNNKLFRQKNHELSKKCKYLHENADIICKNGIFFVSLLAEKYVRTKFVPMKAFFLLIALYSISGKQAVPEPESGVPAGSACVYEQTGNKSGQMTAGNTIDMTFTGYDGVTLQGVTLTMKSNTSSGAGKLQMKVGENTVWEIDNKAFNTSSWAGAYSTEWVEISHALNGKFVSEGANITLHLSASVNSLYLQSVAIEYTAATIEPELYTVSFNTHTAAKIAPLTETEAGGGVILPSVACSDDKWSFFGWWEYALSDTEAAPSVYKVGSRYVPTSDCTLHAVYQSQGEQYPWLPAESLESGDYLITLCVPSSHTLYQAYGKVENNGMLKAKQHHYDDEITEPISLPTVYDNDEVYTLNMLTDSTLSIRHKATGSKVALGSGGKFVTTATKDSIWHITPGTEVGGMPSDTLSADYGGQKYTISLFVETSSTSIYFRPVQNTQKFGLIMYALKDLHVVNVMYTSYPLRDALSEAIANPTLSYKTNIGPYTLIIQNGKKYLQINE